MIYLNTQYATAVKVTLYEMCNNLYDPYFIWKITNQDTKDEYRFFQYDSSNAPYNYNSFTISVIDPTLMQSGYEVNGITDAPPGQYVYEIWESLAPTIDIELLGIKIVERGILNIIGTEQTIPEYIGNLTTNIPTYTGNIY